MSSRSPDFDCAQRVDAAPYVLGALETPGSYREHLATCATCQAEVDELQIVLDTLPATVQSMSAPKALRQRVLATARSEAELLNAAGPEADRPPRRTNRWRSRPITLSIVGAVAACAAAAAIVIASGSSPQERVIPAQIATSIKGAHVSLYQIDNRSNLVVSGMPQPAPGKIYEVWLNRGGASPQPTDALFSVTNRGSGSVAVPENLHGVKEVMVTAEPLGGSSHPTSPPLIRIVLHTKAI
jgi:anti-sigma-K factor RskA